MLLRGGEYKYSKGAKNICWYFFAPLLYLYFYSYSVNVQP